MKFKIILFGILSLLIIQNLKSEPEKEIRGEAGIVAGAGSYGPSVGMFWRYDYVGASFLLTKLYESDISYDPEDVEPPDSNNIIRYFKSNMYGLVIDGHYPLSSYCSVSVSLGFAAESVTKYPYSLTTQRYYKYIKTIEEFYFCYGAGISFYPYKRLSVGISYRNYFGGLISVGVLL